jgi:hypothetical protein
MEGRFPLTKVTGQYPPGTAVTVPSTHQWVKLVLVILQISFLLVASLAVLIVAGVFAAVWHFVHLEAREAPADVAAWLSEISVEGYVPMLRLLDERDFRFLKRQAHFTAAMEARLRAQRYRIFLAYLLDLREDFEAVSSALRFVMVHQRLDRPDLSMTLLRAQLAFARGLAVARLRAYFWSLGFGRVDVRGLLRAFDGIEWQMRSLAGNPGMA